MNQFEKPYMDFHACAQRFLILVLAVSLLFTGGVIAQNETGVDEAEDEEDGGGPVIDLDPLLDGISDLVDAVTGWGGKLEEILTDVIFGPFEALAKALIGILVHVITSYPTVHPSPEVSEIHRITFTVQVLLSTLVFAVAGIALITGPVLGVSYTQVRMIMPRVVIALVFGAVAPQLLQYAVELSHATTLAFKPTEAHLIGTIRLLGELTLVAVIDAMLLLAVAVLFLMRDVYILFAAAIAPLIALGWALPYVKGYADSLIGAFWAALLIGPLDMLVFRLAFSLIQDHGGQVPHWLWSIAALTLLLVVPYLVFSASQSMISTGQRLTPSTTSANRSGNNSNGRLTSEGENRRQGPTKNRGRTRGTNRETRTGVYK